MIKTHCLEHHSKEAAELLAVMGNQKRMMILCNLTRGELQVGSLAEKVGLSQSALSQHLAKLRNQHLVQTRRESQTIFYSIKSDSVHKMLQTLTSIYCAESVANGEPSISKMAANA
ncbi:metalloregulator ArsR/SmtB family transcription factor [Hoeflea sp.]|jgi:DNA-binding transcriptional ArsR family regulator|uniref:ArsR/SmtB family transcription factor n=1 Tax=Hoeflea sp. TaxID=1940281 RepID=UPI002AFE58DB|nr:metalloregulator ArsR/SmtB family transcription factor [Hoeflea sp.]